jgi:hypothetical protein
MHPQYNPTTPAVANLSLDTLTGKQILEFLGVHCLARFVCPSQAGAFRLSAAILRLTVLGSKPLASQSMHKS